jgi:multiple sugar transport system ATP-binding protein
MTVEENLTYSLRIRGVRKAEARKAAAEVAETTGLLPLLKRYPRELSGGQRQRVAMSRAIIRNPKAFLFDEPLSNLDAALRIHMRKEIRALHDRLGATSVYVTHDQIEAMTMADHVVVMREGRIEQQGAPLDLYDRPVNRFVAGFVGSPAMNFVPATVGDGGAALMLDLGDGAQAQALPAPAPLTPGRKVLVGLRPEHLAPVAAGTPGAIAVRLRSFEATGATTYLFTDTRPELTVVVNARARLAAGDRVDLGIDPALVHVFDADSGDRL